jgi:hypothetical protein
MLPALMAIDHRSSRTDMLFSVGTPGHGRSPPPVGPVCANRAHGVRTPCLSWNDVHCTPHSCTGMVDACALARVGSRRNERLPAGDPHCEEPGLCNRMSSEKPPNGDRAGAGHRTSLEPRGAEGWETGHPPCHTGSKTARAAAPFRTTARDQPHSNCRPCSER